MKIVILAGGKGSRLSEYTKMIPKPMVKILNTPLIVRIINHYVKYGFNDFIIAAGYKGRLIKNFFEKNFKGLNVKVVNTGLNTMTGGRLKKLKKYLKNETFLLTYGDGLSNINLKKLIKFHIQNQYVVTLTAVRPPARFGGIKLSGKRVRYFKEKSKLDEGWINGGFFVMEPQIFKYLKDNQTVLERHPLEKLSKIKKLGAFKHTGFWQCVDTIRDKDLIEQTLRKKMY